jgi:hypothetical protein
LTRLDSCRTGDHPDLCDSCYRGPDATCSRLRPHTPVSTGQQRGAHLPHLLRSRGTTPRPLLSIKRDLPVMAHWPIGPVCQSCYTAIVRSPAQCARCRTSQPLIARRGDGAGVCGPCAGLDVDYTCHKYGRGGYPYGNGRCAYCVLAERVNQLLAGRDGAVSTQLQPLVEAFAQVRLPFTAIRWVHASPNAKLLAQIVAGGQPLSHDLLDDLPPTAGVHYIRQIMVETGVLPRRNEGLERVPAWLDHHLADKPLEHATSSVRFCIGFCCGEHAIAQPRAVTRHQQGVTCVAGSWSPLSCCAKTISIAGWTRRNRSAATESATS